VRLSVALAKVRLAVAKLRSRLSIVPFIRSTLPYVKAGRYTYGLPTFLIFDQNDRIEIGSFCSISGNVHIFGGGEHNIDWVSTYPFRVALGLARAGRDGHPKTRGPVVIGNDVWIGFAATILSGVTIGDGAVIGTGSVVTGDIEPYSVVAGNPARHIRYRFGDQERSRLLALRWWDWPIDQIRAQVDRLCSPEVAAFLKENSGQT